MNCLQWQKVLVICPASLRLNWKRECEKWLTTSPEIGVVTNGKECPGGDLIICNYELLGKHEVIRETLWDIIFIDECHNIKGKSQRTKNTLAIRAKRKVYITGTPILNRPSELFNIAHDCAPKLFPSWWGYAKRYCDMKQTRFGMDVSGASNLGELQAKLKSSFMLRRLVDDVLPDLPKKRRQVIELPPSKEMRIVLNRESMQWKLHEETLSKLVARRDAALVAQNEEEYRSAARELKAAYAVSFAEMAGVRKETAKAKLPLCIQHIRDMMEGGVDKLIVFCYHYDIAEPLMEELAEYKPVRIMGEDTLQSRQNAVDAFQDKPEHRIFVGSIKAAGVGITLTAACTVIFVESDWTPALLNQAEDRSRRIGQKRPVLIQHLVLESSLDAHMLRRVIEKQEVIDQALDSAPPQANGEPDKVKVKVKVDYAQEGRRFNATQRSLLIKCLKVVAGLDADGARQRNGEGFSTFHTELGKELAGKFQLTDSQAGFAAMLVKRYRKQIDAGLVKLTGVEV